MPKVVEIIVDTQILDRIIRQVPQKANDLLDLAARRIETRAKGTVPVDTGALKNSINVSSPATFTRHIGDGVEYGIYIEKGARGRSARPFLGNAVEAERSAFTKAWGQLLE